MIETFADREALADAAAGLIALQLSEAIAARGHAGFIVTGGASPEPVYDRLAKTHLDWRKVTATLSDDRWVDAKDPHSNELLVRTRLQTGLAAPMGLVSLKYPAPSVEAGSAMADEAVDGLFPVDVTLLGMGEDGHIASLFPGDPILSSALDPDDSRQVVAVPVSGLAPFTPRLSLTLAALIDARSVLLLVTGEAKATILARIGADPAYDPPAASLLRQTRTPVRVLWAP